jgi:hypothetical protein
MSVLGSDPDPVLGSLEWSKKEWRSPTNRKLYVCTTCEVQAKTTAKIGGYVEQSLAEALQHLARAIRKLTQPLGHPEIKKYAQRYFLIQQLTSGLIKQIKAILLRTQAGLAGEGQRVTIRVAEQLTERDDWGIVNKDPVEESVEGLNIVRGLQDQQKYKRGDIHVKMLLFKRDPDPDFPNHADVLRRRQRLACVTLIHEATHKFAGTWDYCAFDDDGLGPKPKEKLDNQASALQNADGFAWFAYKAGKEG